MAKIVARLLEKTSVLGALKQSMNSAFNLLIMTCAAAQLSACRPTVVVPDNFTLPVSQEPAPSPVPGGEPDPVPLATADHLLISAGDAQTGAAGALLAVSPRVRVVDANGNGMAGILLDFSVLSGGGNVGTTRILSDEQGYASTPWTLGTGVGVNTLSVSGVSGLAGTPSEITFSATAEPAAFSPPRSSLATSSAALVADGAAFAVIRATLRDAYDNVIAGKTVTVATDRGASDTFTAVSAVTDETGTATFNLKSTLAGVATVTASDASDGGTISQTVQVTFVPGNPAAAQSTVSASAASIPADGTSVSTMTVTLKDAQLNAVPATAVSLFSSRGATDTIATLQGTTDENGVATFTVKSSSAGSSTYTATASTGSVTISQTATVSFTPLAPGAFSLTGATPGNAQVVLSWGASSGAASYTVKYGTTSGNYVTTFSANATSPATVTGLNNGTRYYFKVFAVNSGGTTLSTGELNAIPVAPTANTCTGTSAYTITYSTDTQDVDLYQAAKSLCGWDGVTAKNIFVTVNAGVTIGASSPGAIAFQVPQSFPTGSYLQLTNHGKIQGAGGYGGQGAYCWFEGNSGSACDGAYTAATPGTRGGTALSAAFPILVANTDGKIWGGGGGGGGGYAWSTSMGDETQGGNGGAGAGSAAGQNPSSGSAGTAGAVIWQGGDAYAGGDGGGPGQAGSAGPNGGAAGGIAGYAVLGDSNFISWSGTGERLGPISSSPARSFATPGTYTFTVPPTITSLNVMLAGGGGAGGGDGWGGAAATELGSAGAQVSGTVNVTSGQTLTIHVASGGGAGSDSVDIYAGSGGTGGTGYVAGTNGTDGGNDTGGGGGGGGGASAILKPDLTILASAKGGTGGAGGEMYGGAGGAGGGSSGIPDGSPSIGSANNRVSPRTDGLGGSVTISWDFTVLRNNGGATCNQVCSSAGKSCVSIGNDPYGTNGNWESYFDCTGSCGMLLSTGGTCSTLISGGTVGDLAVCRCQ